MLVEAAEAFNIIKIKIPSSSLLIFTIFIFFPFFVVAVLRNVETLPRIVKHLKDLRCCDGDAVTLECHIEGTPEPNVFWEKDGKILHDRSTEHRQNFNGHKATLSIPRIFPEDEGQYCLVACNNMGRIKSSACIIVDGN